MAIDIYLDKIDDLLEEAWSLPLMGKKRAVDIEKIRELLDDIRMRLPQEIKDARAIVSDREDIISDAKREAEDIIKRAEQRARQLLSDEEIIKNAKAKAGQMLTETQGKTKEMERAAIDFSENALKRSEDALLLALNEVKSTRLALRNRPKARAAAKEDEKSKPGTAGKYR
jgi:uncharacterized protein YecA (UPF0149 family)